MRPGASVLPKTLLLLGTRFIHHDLSPTEIGPIQFLDGFSGLFFCRHFDKTESARLIRKLVANNRSRDHLSTLGKEVLHVLLLGIIRQPAHEKLLLHVSPQISTSGVIPERASRT